MELYDARNPLKCKICGFEISHNRQGWFTSHLKEHGISLELYLKKYFYSKKDLVCSYELCTEEVQLTRGVPNKFCSRSCRQKKPPLKCVVCGSTFEAQNRATKTCSGKCATINRSYQIKKWHKNMSLVDKEKHFSNIITKTARTRRRNRTPSWNSGKKGIYKEETLEKIRQATLLQMQKPNYRKSNIERKIESLLIDWGINYKYSFILEKRQFDFLLINHKIIIECDGDYWHANPKFYPIPKQWQIERIEIDQLKNEIAQTHGYNIIRFWEDDIINNFKYIERTIYDLLATT